MKEGMLSNFYVVNINVKVNTYENLLIVTKTATLII